MDLIGNVLSCPEFKEKPPVLLDIGASGPLNPDWKRIAPHSICIGFDADRRDLETFRKRESDFYRFHVIDKIVAETGGTRSFYLTRFPHCSSLLVPDMGRLADWSFHDLFAVEKTVDLSAVTLSEVMRGLSIEHIDWFKTDSQGTDLRLFQSLGDKTTESVLVAEFEPGIMDAYQGEDKMHGVMAHMDRRPFWLCDLRIKGPERIRPETMAKYLTRSHRRFLREQVNRSAFWGEMTYINTFGDERLQTRRHLLLGWVFSTVKRQHGFALELAEHGRRRLGGPLFTELAAASVRSLRRQRWYLPVHLAARIWDRVRRRLLAGYF